MAEFSMDRVVEILQAKGVPNAYVEQTGGGCATIFADGTRYAVAAGPGAFGRYDGSEFHGSVGDTDEFCIGADDYGDGPHFYVSDKPDAATMTAEDIANLIHEFLTTTEGATSMTDVIYDEIVEVTVAQ